ncbi:WD40 repeat-like protein [Suillus decipiens]|nr:WD40 repeat-like protein [Suillus decipiens]
MASSSTQPSGNGLTLKPVMTLEGHEPWHCDSSDSQDAEYDPVSSISYFPDGKQIVSGSSDKTIRRWDLREGREIEKARDVCKDDVRIVEVSRSGRWVVTVNEWELKVSEVETGIVRTFHEDIGIIDISADSTLLAGASPNSIVRIWDLNTGELVAGPFKLLDDYPISMGLRLSDDSRKLAGISLYLKKPGLYLQVWDVQAQKLDIQKSTPYNVNYISPVPVFWTTNNKSIVAAFTDDADDPRATTTRTIYEFDASTLKIVGAPFKGHTRVITGLALSPDCVLLVSSSYDNTIKLWSFESRQLLASFDVKSPRNLVLSPVSCQLAYTTWHETKIYICNIPANILASIGLAEELQLSTSKSKDATPRLVRRKPVIPLMYPISRPLGARDPQISRRHFLRKLLPSSFRTDTVPTDDPRDLLHFPVTSPLPRPLLDSDPSILASIQPVPQVRTSHGAPRNLAQLGPDLELLHSSSHTHTLSFTSNGEHGDLPPEATLQDLSEYIIKDGDYPVTRGGFGEICRGESIAGVR